MNPGTLVSIALLTLGELGDAVTSYIGSLRGLQETNHLVVMAGPTVFYAWKLAPVAIFLLVALLFQDNRVQRLVSNVCLLTAGAVLGVTFLNIGQLL